MRQRDRSRLSIFIVVIALLLLALHSVAAQDQPAFNIGVLDDERGSISDGARLAVREINDAGGVRGADGTLFQLNLVFSPTNAGQSFSGAVDALQAANLIAVLGPESSDDVLNNLDALDSLGVPVITPATDDTILMSDTSGMLFRSRAADAVQGRALASYLITQYQLSPIATIQLDIASTARVIGFTTAATSLGVTPQPALILRDPTDLTDSVGQLVDANPAVIAAFGSPDVASTLYGALRTQGWTGLFAYDQAFDPSFRDSVPMDQLPGVVAANTWAFTSADSSSTSFLNNYIHAYGELPGSVEAASYNSVNLIAAALTQPGSLHDNLGTLPEIQGVQGLLRTDDLGIGELSNNVAIVRLGQLGAPEVLARYQGDQILPTEVPATPPAVAPTEIPTTEPTQAPLMTATPTSAFLTITQALQNVRSGPGDNYDVLGQLTQGTQVPVIGASEDFSYVVIDYRGQQGWLVASLLSISGDLTSVPVIPAPPPSAPAATITPSPTPAPADLIIVSASVSPSPVVPNQPFTVSITVGNIGGTPAGQFTVAGTFPPNNQLLVATVPGLAPQQTATVTLSGILNGSGSYTTALQIDANNQVNEGTIGEQNNLYNISYSLDIPVLRQGSQTLNLGDTIDLEGNGVQGDANWNNDGGNPGLKAIFGAHLGILGSGGDYNAVTYSLINPSIITRDSIGRSEMNSGTLIGIITADGHRGVMQVTAISDTQISLNFRVYNG